MTIRTAINPWDFSLNAGFNQAELVEGHQRELFASGQDAVDAEGNPQHPGDMGAQLELALDNLQAVVAAADMTLANVVRLNIYATDVAAYLEHHGRLMERFGESRFATSLVGVSQLAAPGLAVLLEATAVD